MGLVVKGYLYYLQILGFRLYFLLQINTSFGQWYCLWTYTVIFLQFLWHIISRLLAFIFIQLILSVVIHRLKVIYVSCKQVRILDQQVLKQNGQWRARVFILHSGPKLICWVTKKYYAFLKMAFTNSNCIRANVRPKYVLFCHIIVTFRNSSN